MGKKYRAFFSSGDKKPDEILRSLAGKPVINLINVSNHSSFVGKHFKSICRLSCEVSRAQKSKQLFLIIDGIERFSIAFSSNLSSDTFMQASQTVAKTWLDAHKEYVDLTSAQIVYYSDVLKWPLFTTVYQTINLQNSPEFISSATESASEYLKRIRSRTVMSDIEYIELFIKRKHNLAQEQKGGAEITKIFKVISEELFGNLSLDDNTSIKNEGLESIKNRLDSDMLAYIKKIIDEQNLAIAVTALKEEMAVLFTLAIQHKASFATYPGHEFKIFTECRKLFQNQASLDWLRVKVKEEKSEKSEVQSGSPNHSPGSSPPRRKPKSSSSETSSSDDDHIFSYSSGSASSSDDETVNKVLEKAERRILDDKTLTEHDAIKLGKFYGSFYNTVHQRHNTVKSARTLLPSSEEAMSVGKKARVQLANTEES